MDSKSDCIEPVTPGLSFRSFCKPEDSGYCTFTPNGIEADLTKSRCSPGFVNSTCITTHIKTELYGSPELTTIVSNQNVRSRKRLYQDIVTQTTSSTIPTPTSSIAGKIKSLDVSGNKENTDCFIPSCYSDCGSVSISRPLKGLIEYDPNRTYPSTPVKNNCKLNPCRKAPKKLNFMHSLSCDIHELQPGTKKKTCEKVSSQFYRPDKKIDIIHLLHKQNVIPPLLSILKYLSNEDIQNFKLVSLKWSNIWESVDIKRKQDFINYCRTVKENQENRKKGHSIKTIEISRQTKVLSDIHNELTVILPNGNTKSPPNTPRTNRFRKFAKAAMLDSRSQVSCIRCCQPAKLTEESSGEMWAECTNISCAYKFCKHCQCDRHPGRCFQYSLDGPSPSKRKKNQYAVGTKKSRKNLRRLIDLAH